MPLSVVATPIGNFRDISLRALEALKTAELIIGEERKITGRLIKEYELGPKTVELLNEHSDAQDLQFLLNECKTKLVALVSDCGTPAFCDPGADLVDLCRKSGVSVTIIPGASSLMTFLSGAGVKVNSFYFSGFLPAKTELREESWSKIKLLKQPVIIMDTPYRLSKTLEDLCKHVPNKRIILGTSLTQQDESFDIGSPKQLLTKFNGQKKEFVLAIV